LSAANFRRTSYPAFWYHFHFYHYTANDGSGVLLQILKHIQLENVAISDVLPLKAVRRNAITNLKCFWGFRHVRPNFDGYIYIHYAAPPHSARISAIYLLPFGNVWLCSVSACNVWEAQCRIYEGWVKTLIVFYAVCGPKFTKFSDNAGSPLVLSNALFRLSVSRFFQKKFAIKCQSRRGTQQMQMFFGPQFSW